MRWFEQHRMEWIRDALHVFGFINRQHLERKFGVSAQQASLDLRQFQKLHPDAMAYDLSAKRYVALTITGCENHRMASLKPVAPATA